MAVAAAIAVTAAAAAAAVTGAINWVGTATLMGAADGTKGLWEETDVLAGAQAAQVQAGLPCSQLTLAAVNNVASVEPPRRPTSGSAAPSLRPSRYHLGRRQRQRQRPTGIVICDHSFIIV